MYFSLTIGIYYFVLAKDNIKDKYFSAYYSYVHLRLPLESTLFQNSCNFMVVL